MCVCACMRACVCPCVRVCGLKLDNAMTILHTVVSAVPNTAEASQLSGALANGTSLPLALYI